MSTAAIDYDVPENVTVRKPHPGQEVLVLGLDHTWVVARVVLQTDPAFGPNRWYYEIKGQVGYFIGPTNPTHWRLTHVGLVQNTATAGGFTDEDLLALTWADHVETDGCVNVYGPPSIVDALAWLLRESREWDVIEDGRVSMRPGQRVLDVYPSED